MLDMPLFSEVKYIFQHSVISMQFFLSKILSNVSSMTHVCTVNETLNEDFDIKLKMAQKVRILS